MLIKIIGLILICVSSTFSGIYSALKIKFHISNLKQINTALNILKSEIEFGITPLCETAKNISAQSNSFIHEIFSKIDDMLEKRLYPAKKIWVNAINSITKKIYIDNDDIGNLKSFSNVISNPDRQLQIKSLQTIILQTEKKISLLELKYQSEKKLYCNLGFLFGLLVVIIFI